MHGWLILDKPLGLGSTQAVAAVKRALRDGGYPKVKVGHGGTLDPLATGVLPVALGEATKLAGRLLNGDKVYAFTVHFGEETDTLDLEGRVIATADARPTMAEIGAVLPRFTGEIEQVPPAFSALKVDGERAYDLARAGEADVHAGEPERERSLSVAPPRDGDGDRRSRWGGASFSGSRAACPVHNLLRERSPSQGRGDDIHEITLVAHVSKGTYIRSARPRHRARARHRRPRHPCCSRTRAGPFDLAAGDIAGQIEPKPLRRASLNTTSCRLAQGWTTSRLFR
ncbi:tRNA pseudouridine(55) synthase TruB [Sphingomonas sp.]|uniref:tRNA pseudouridine(55) synthase TruB n=1 Tax=Sphingomonas sp. TaxID=28214 RepID=UPI003CC5E991